MRCEACQGMGFVSAEFLHPGYMTISNQYEPCPDCSGSGVGYCCDSAGANLSQTKPDENVTSSPGDTSDSNSLSRR